MEIQPPLDPRPDATEITLLSDLDTYELTIEIPKINRADAEIMACRSDSTENVIIEELDNVNSIMLDAFCVGDKILKVNDEPPQSFEHFKEILCDLSPCTVTVKRRSFVTAPGYERRRRSLDDMGLPFQFGYTYQVVNCKKQTWDRFLTTSFGFEAVNVALPEDKTNKYVIGEIFANSAAEKYFSVGDALIDFRGTAIRPGNDMLKQFNATFQKGKDMDVLIERPVDKYPRYLTEEFIKKYLKEHREPTMNKDAVNIGKKAAYYHNLLWRKIEAVGILLPTPPPGETLKCAVPRDPLILEEKKSYQEISTDVSADQELEAVGYRYSSEGEDDKELHPARNLYRRRRVVDEEKEEEEDDDESRRRVLRARAARTAAAPAARAAPRAVAVPYGPAARQAAAPATPAAPAAPFAVAVPYANGNLQPATRKADSRKSKGGLFSYLFNSCSPFKK